MSVNDSSLELLDKWGCPLDPEMLVLALTHRSFAHERQGTSHNERLEFLGDAVLQLIVTEHLYAKYPDHPEGHLAKMRAATVSQGALAHAARRIGLGEYILLGKGELKSGGANKDSILSDTVEAMIGATYLCQGMEVTKKIVLDLVSDLLERALERGAGMDWKTSLQELLHETKEDDVVLEVSWKGPDHNRVFQALALQNHKVIGEGRGSSKKIAEHAAAKEALFFLREKHQITKPLGF